MYCSFFRPYCYAMALSLFCVLNVYASNDTTKVVTPRRTTNVLSVIPPVSQFRTTYSPQRQRSFRQLVSTSDYVNAEQEADRLLHKLYLQKRDTTDSTTHKKVDAIHKLHDFVRNNDLLVKTLNLKAPIQLPIGVYRVIAGTEYIVLIDSILVAPNGNARLNTRMSLTTPNGKRLAFEGEMTVSSEGGLVGEARLKLLEDVPLKFTKGVLLNLKAQETYVSVDCNGFKELGIGGEVTFTNLVEDLENGMPGEKPIVTNFSTKIRSWNDLVVKLDMPDFQIRGIKGLGFRVEDAVFDFSDSRNAAGFSLPDNYDASWLPEPNSVLWQGIYFRSIKVALPRFIESSKVGDTTRNDTTRSDTAQQDTTQMRNRVVFLGENLVLDETGFTGKVSVRNLISRKDGKLDGWAFSVDYLAFAFQANTLTYFEIEGEINLPLAPKDDGDVDDNRTRNDSTRNDSTRNDSTRIKSNYLSYKAMLDFASDEFLFAAGTNRPINIPLFGGNSKLLLTQTYLEAKISQGKVHPRAILTGKLVVDNKILNIDEIRFEGLELSSNGVDKFDKVDVRFGEKKAGKFPIQILEIGLMTQEQVTESDSTGMLNDNKREDETAYLGVKLGVRFNFSKSISADGYITLLGAKYKKNGYHKWRYKGTQIHEVSVDTDQGAFLLKGSLRFFKNDEVYGNGFNGNLMLAISTEEDKGFGMRASAIFGKVNGMRYWYADALAVFNPGLPLGATGLSIYGFGGGLYSRMRKRQQTETGPVSNLGKTATGTVYIPDASTKLGLKATVVLGTAESLKPFQGEVTFELSFNQHGGIKYFGFEGYAYFLNEGDSTKFEDLVKAPEDRRDASPISAQVVIDYDVENRVFHMVAGVQIKVESGAGAKINGGGQMVMHFAPDEWYIHMGTPESRIGVDATVAGITTSTGIYFMTGSSVPEIPPPPQQVLDILGMETQSINARDSEDLLHGRGFAIGFSLETHKKIDAAIAYMQAHIGLGFDISYKKYAANVRCAGRSGTIGVNGWFGQGQAYIFAIGDVGIKIKKKKVSIGQVSAALLAQLQFFNPTWVKGTLGGRFKILGGLVKGKFKISVELGQHCDLVGVDNSGAGLLSDVQIISDITPTNLNGPVDVFTTPQVAFNMPVGVTFQIEDNDGNPVDFRAKLEKMEVTSNGQVLTGNLKWNDDQDVVVFQTTDVLPSETQVTVDVKLVFEERRGGGTWQVVDAGDSTYTEEKQATFTTGAAPNYIPLFNMAASYPVINQLHLHKGETNTGFIQLHMGQNYLFDLGDDSEWEAQKIRWINVQTGEKIETDFTYNAAAKRLEFDLATAGLQTATIYQLDIVNLPKANTTAIDANVQNDAKTIVTTNDTVTVANKKITETQKNYQEQSIMDSEGMYFRTSKYNTLADKVNALQFQQGSFMFVAPNVDAMYNYITGDELFDKIELEGIVVNRNGYEYNIPPLIQLEADLPNTPWQSQQLDPTIYNGYPFGNGIDIQWRQPTSLGVPPVKGLGLAQFETSITLSPDNLNYTGIQAPYLHVLYDVAHYASSDMYDLQQTVATAISQGNQVSSHLIDMLTKTFPPMTTNADYPIKLNYILPTGAGIGEKISTANITLRSY